MPPAPALATMLPPPRSRPTIMPCGHLTRRRRGGRDEGLLQGVVRSMQINARSLCPEVPCCVHGPDLCWCRQVQQVDHRSHHHYLGTQVPTGPLAAGCWMGQTRWAACHPASGAVPHCFRRCSPPRWGSSRSRSLSSLFSAAIRSSMASFSRSSLVLTWIVLQQLLLQFLQSVLDSVQPVPSPFASPPPACKSCQLEVVRQHSSEHAEGHSQETLAECSVMTTLHVRDMQPAAVSTLSACRRVPERSLTGTVGGRVRCLSPERGHKMFPELAATTPLGHRTAPVATTPTKLHQGGLC